MATATSGTKKKALVYPCDNLFGRNLCTLLGSQSYTVQGVTSDTLQPSKGTIPRSDLPAIKKALLEADVVIYQAHGNVQDATNALKMLSHSHYENPKTFVFVSSIMTWYETKPLEAAEGDPTEKKELEPLSEDQYNKRVPHAKYLVWKEVEKLCRNANSVKLQTYILFAGLTYGSGEDLLYPLFKQAWHLCPEGLPMFGKGDQMLPMIHVADLVNAVAKICALAEPLEQRYIFAVDEGYATYTAFINALNTSMGPSVTFDVKEKEVMLFENVEYFTVNLKLEPGQINTLLGDEWQCKSGIVENMARVCAEFKTERGIEPLKICILGAPSTGKTFFSRELSLWYKIPHFTIADIIADYVYQEVELKEALETLRHNTMVTKRNERLMEKKRVKLEEMREAERNAAGQVGEEGDDGSPAKKPIDPDEEDIDEIPDIKVTLDEAEEKELQEAIDSEDSENKEKYNTKLEEIKKVLAMRIKTNSSEGAELNPKKKPAAKAKSKAEEPMSDPSKLEPPRYTDRALTLMVRWKLERMESRNQGYILDGYPKSVKQAQLLFQEGPVEILEDPDEIQRDQVTESVDDKPSEEKIFPQYTIHLKASDTYLLERVQKIQDEAPHNTPEDFQRRLEVYKTNFENPKSVGLWLESATFANAKAKKPNFTQMSVESCPLVLAMSNASMHAPKQWDQLLTNMSKFIGPPRNFGVSPQEAKAEKQREKAFGDEKRSKAAQEAQVRAGAESADRDSLQQRRKDEEQRLTAVKAHEREMLEQRKEPMKKYLMDNVIPVLTKGLIEICERRPEDPVDALAEWLFRHNPTELEEF